MDLLSNEIHVHILSFLQVKDALMLSMASTHFMDIIANNSKVVRDTFTKVSKYAGHYEETKVTNIDGVAKVLLIQKESTVQKKRYEEPKVVFYNRKVSRGVYSKGKMHGIWEDITKDEMGNTISRMYSFWENGRLNYSHERKV
ncbi:hypothetical protein [Brazilian marseillevirus]|uniref:hypothetical protein n=1 Tax=Brazilian marseillevirus TaxID=1813599 RepID=UPI0007824B2F|nr:hypothetical protein A3303_gp212 [Brazilian marseillevirus]AMQ10720.1 hypothetical protein [Brazilian marseillevirus]